MTTPKKATGHGGADRSQGRKPIGEDRGGAVHVHVRIFGDQAEWLKTQGNQQKLIRDAIDLLMGKETKTKE